MVREASAVAWKRAAYMLVTWLVGSHLGFAPRPMQLWLGAIVLACNLATTRCISFALGRTEAPMSPGADALLWVSLPKTVTNVLAHSLPCFSR